MSLDTQSESLDCVPSYCQEVQVESVVITQYIENELSISEENDDGVQYDLQDPKECDPVDTKNSTEVTYEEIETLDMHTVDTKLDERSEKQDPVKVSVTDMKAADGGEESLTPQEETGVVTNQKESTDLVGWHTIKQPFVKLDRLDLSGRHFSKTFNPAPPKRGRGRPKKDPQNKTSCMKKQGEKRVPVPCASVNKYALIIIIIIVLFISYFF